MSSSMRIFGALITLVLAGNIAAAQAPVIEFDHEHSDYDALLEQYVSDGLVDYEGLLAERGSLDDYVAALGDFPPVGIARFSPDQRMAFYINAYNAFTIQLILDHYPLESIQDIENAWDKKDFMLMGERLSLSNLEKRRILGQFKEPLLHFALNCASLGCPPLRAEAWTATHIDQKLIDSASSFARDPERFELDKEARIFKVSKLFDWHSEDFVIRWGGTELPPGPDEPVRHRGIIGFYLEYGDEDTAAFLGENPVTIEFLDYDWSLNVKREG